MLVVDMPEDLFEPLLKTKCSLRQIAKIVEMLRGEHRAEVEFCPHCSRAAMDPHWHQQEAY
jgi:hypothetical protein